MDLSVANKKYIQKIRKRISRKLAFSPQNPLVKANG
jgi:hypothetical protein